MAAPFFAAAAPVFFFAAPFFAAAALAAERFALGSTAGFVTVAAAVAAAAAVVDLRALLRAGFLPPSGGARSGSLEPRAEASLASAESGGAPEPELPLSARPCFLGRGFLAPAASEASDGGDAGPVCFLALVARLFFGGMASRMSLRRLSSASSAFILSISSSSNSRSFLSIIAPTLCIPRQASKHPACQQCYYCC